MATTHIQKSKKKQQGLDSEKSAQDKVTYGTGKENINIKSKNDETFEVDGILYPLPPDYHELEEFDWDDPENIKMVQEEENAFAKKYGRLTSEQFDEICLIKDKIKIQKPELNRGEAFDLAWEQYTGKKLPIEKSN